MVQLTYGLIKLLIKKNMKILPNHSLIEDQAQDVPADIKLRVGRLFFFFDELHEQDTNIMVMSHVSISQQRSKKNHLLPMIDKQCSLCNFSHTAV